jgi:predicted nucleic-acid-binding protein
MLPKLNLGRRREGVQMGLTMKEKKAVTREFKPRYQKATKKEKKAILDEYTRLTGYHRKSAVRLLCAGQVRQVMLYSGGKPVKVKQEKKRPSNRKGKRIYTDEVINCLRLVWTFFWFKCGKILAPLMRQQMGYIAKWPAFGITRETAEKLKKISRDTIEKAVMAILGKDTILCNRELFIEVLPVYTSHPKLSFADCYLEVLARRTENAPLLTFDQKLASQLSGAKLLSKEDA